MAYFVHLKIKEISNKLWYVLVLIAPTNIIRFIFIIFFQIPQDTNQNHFEYGCAVISYQMHTALKCFHATHFVE